MPEEYEEVKNVTFSGKYPLEFSEEDIENVRSLVVYVQVARRSKSPYLSMKTNPPNGFLGTICAINNGHVLQRYDIDFEKQCFFFGEDVDRQLLPSQVCIVNQESQNLTQVAQALGLSVSLAPNAYLDSLTNRQVREEQLFFNCYADVALNVVVQRLKYELCNDDANPPPPPPKPKPVPPPPEVPPGEPVPPSIYAPPPPGSGSNYEPFPGDRADPPGEGEECLSYAVSYIMRDPGNANFTPIEASVQVLGIVVGFETIPSSTNPGLFDVVLRCGGQDLQDCLQGSAVPILTNGTEQAFGEVVSVVLIP